MIKVAVLAYYNTNALNGAALYAKRFVTYKKIFQDSDIDINLYDMNSHKNSVELKINEEQNRKNELAYMSSKQYKLKKNIKMILRCTRWGNQIYLYFAWVRHGKRVVYLNKEQLYKADIILSNDIWTAYYALELFPEKKVYIILHNNGDIFKMLQMELPKLKGTKAWRMLEKMRDKVYKNAERIIFVANTAKAYFKRCYPQYSQKTVYVPVGIECREKFKNRTYDTLRLVCVGTVCPRKNQIGIIKALNEISDKSIHLIVVGTGSDFELCQSYIKNHEMKNVEMVGAVDDVNVYLEKSNVFISASLDEGLPAVAIEALRSGLPVILTDAGGCRELVRNNGYLIPCGDKEALIKAIKDLKDKRDRIDEFSRNSRIIFENEFSIDRMINIYCDLFKESMISY
ncbi:MAG: glycosyltransferase family 4 protein [Hungatella sp.]|nr:glycosyltransferase family 4 protein [Hungatella sp.]